jgi:hypothetical protein
MTNLAIAGALGPLLAMRLEVLHVLLDAAGRTVG